MTAWCAARPRDEVIRVFTDAEAAIGPVLDVAEVTADPHVVARGSLVELDGTPMQGLVARLSATPGVLRWQGRPIDADGAEIRANGWNTEDTPR
jgi:crotonobetainyl-CoA:carnitine CoA-transferase CaiB-like acyl-CoA transferase